MLTETYIVWYFPGMGRVSERGSKIKKHKWTRREDEALISALTGLCQNGWKRDNNIFRSGYTTVLEKELKSKLPGCNLKASPHIESRLKTLKKHCDAITDMKDAFGIEWKSADSTLICYDDDVWEDWVKDHSDAKGLRNKPFPYYDELCLIFGKTRGNHKTVEDASNGNKTLTVYETSDLAFDQAYRSNEKVLETENHESDHEEGNDHKGDEMGADDLNDHDHDDDDDDNDDDDDDDASIDDIIRTPDSANKKKGQGQGQGSGGCMSGMELAKIFEALLKRNEEQYSILAGLVGREVAADKAAAEKRAGLNGELKRIPNLGLQARLRAASIIVGDQAKLDLFYSLESEERKEWVSMLLSGLI
ncbi:unnamed protein product [Lactuca saligna]|uniref:Myb/SANT-like domain-containing protein n=1 Tax=Lactuca saligna TaxID=75948 RepID=A0AA35YJK9_LACSI|nr:unnamed protein product [Lactuca saligna]